MFCPEQSHAGWSEFSRAFVARPTDGVKATTENLGEQMMGDVIELLGLELSHAVSFSEVDVTTRLTWCSANRTPAALSVSIKLPSVKTNET